MKKWMFRTVLSLAALCLISGQRADAGLFDGQQLQVEILYPDLATHYDSSTQVITGGSTNYVYAPTTIQASGDTLTLTFDGSGTFGTGSFNGFHFNDISGTIASFTGFSIVSSTLPGFNASDLNFTANDLYVNVSGLNYSPDYSVVLSVSSAGTGPVTVVPEPATMASAAIGGVLGLGLLVRRRRAAR